MELTPRTFTITEEQDNTLVQEAAKRQAETGKRVSVSEVLRDILDAYRQSGGNGKEASNA